MNLIDYIDEFAKEIRNTPQGIELQKSYNDFLSVFEENNIKHNMIKELIEGTREDWYFYAPYVAVENIKGYIKSEDQKFPVSKDELEKVISNEKVIKYINTSKKMCEIINEYVKKFIDPIVDANELTINPTIKNIIYTVTYYTAKMMVLKDAEYVAKNNQEMMKYFSIRDKYLDNRTINSPYIQNVEMFLNDIKCIETRIVNFAEKSNLYLYICNRIIYESFYENMMQLNPIQEERYENYPNALIYARMVVNSNDYVTNMKEKWIYKMEDGSYLFVNQKTFKYDKEKGEEFIFSGFIYPCEDINFFNNLSMINSLKNYKEYLDKQKENKEE